MKKRYNTLGSVSLSEEGVKHLARKVLYHFEEGSPLFEILRKYIQDYRHGTNKTWGLLPEAEILVSILEANADNVLDFSEDNAVRARQRGYRLNGGNVVFRRDPLRDYLKERNLENCKIKFTEKVDVSGFYAVLDAGLIEPSHVDGLPNPLHFITEAQPKDRTDDVSQATAEHHAANIEPDLILKSRTAYSGAPIVNMRGEVIQGNGRANALKIMYSRRTSEYERSCSCYSEAIRALWGGVALSRTRNPIVVRVIDADDSTAIELGQYTDTQLTTGGEQKFNPRAVATALVNKQRMAAFCSVLFRTDDDDTKTLSEIITATGADALAVLNRENFITPAEYSSCVDKLGRVNQNGRDAVRGILEAVLYNGAADNFGRMFDDTARVPAKVKTALVAVVYRDLKMPDDRKIVPEVQDAVTVLYEVSKFDPEFSRTKILETARRTVALWAKQYSFDANGNSYLPAARFSSMALELAARFRAYNRNTIKAVLEKMYDKMSGTDNDMFAADFGKKLTLSEAAKAVLEIDYTPRAALNGIDLYRRNKRACNGLCGLDGVLNAVTYANVSNFEKLRKQFHIEDPKVLAAWPDVQTLLVYNRIPLARQAIEKFACEASKAARIPDLKKEKYIPDISETEWDSFKSVRTFNYPNVHSTHFGKYLGYYVIWLRATRRADDRDFSIINDLDSYLKQMGFAASNTVFIGSSGFNGECVYATLKENPAIEEVERHLVQEINRYETLPAMDQIHIRFLASGVKAWASADEYGFYVHVYTDHKTDELNTLLNGHDLKPFKDELHTYSWHKSWGKHNKPTEHEGYAIVSKLSRSLSDYCKKHKRKVLFVCVEEKVNPSCLLRTRHHTYAGSDYEIVVTDKVDAKKLINALKPLNFSGAYYREKGKKCILSTDHKQITIDDIDALEAKIRKFLGVKTKGPAVEKPEPPKTTEPKPAPKPKPTPKPTPSTDGAPEPEEDWLLFRLGSNYVSVDNKRVSISFAGIPDEDTRTALKGLSFRWDRNARNWYLPDNAENRQTAIRFVEDHCKDPGNKPATTDEDVAARERKAKALRLRISIEAATLGI